MVDPTWDSIPRDQIASQPLRQYDQLCLVDQKLILQKNHFFLPPIILDNFNKEYSFKVSIFLVVHKILLVRGTLRANFARLFKSFELGNILQVVLPDV